MMPWCWHCQLDGMDMSDNKEGSPCKCDTRGDGKAECETISSQHEQVHWDGSGD